MDLSNPNVLASTLIPVGSNKSCQFPSGWSLIPSAFIIFCERRDSPSVPAIISYAAGSLDFKTEIGMLISTPSIVIGTTTLRPLHPISTSDGLLGEYLRIL